MTSNDYVPERIIQKIDGEIFSYLENGLIQFYMSLGLFEFKVYNRTEFKHDDNDVRLITMRDLEAPFICHFSLTGICFFVFILELIVFQIKKWRIRHRCIIQSQD